MKYWTLLIISWLACIIYEEEEHAHYSYIYTVRTAQSPYILSAHKPSTQFIAEWIYFAKNGPTLYQLNFVFLCFYSCLIFTVLKKWKHLRCLLAGHFCTQNSAGARAYRWPDASDDYGPEPLRARRYASNIILSVRLAYLEVLMPLWFIPPTAKILLRLPYRVLALLAPQI